MAKKSVQKKAPASRKAQTSKKAPAPQKAPAQTPKKDFDVEIRAQLEQYGLELNDIVAVLEEDPAMMRYVMQGPKGQAIAVRAKERSETNHVRPAGRCASRDTGVKNTINSSKLATEVLYGNGNDIQLAAQMTGDYFTVTYHTAETAQKSAKSAVEPAGIVHYAPAGAILNWENQDEVTRRIGDGGVTNGHTTIKVDDNVFYSDGFETNTTIHGIVFYGRSDGKPRYGSLSYVTFPKDVTFSPELINLAMMRKRERETDRQIPVTEMPKKPGNFVQFYQKNPRLGYLVIKQVNPNVPFKLTADGGKKLLQYYNNLPSNSPELAALNLLAGKNIKNTMDYTAVNKAVEEVSSEVLRLRNPEAFAARKPASTKQISYLCNVAPTYISELRKVLTGEEGLMTSRQCKDYIAGLDKNSAEYLAISQLARKASKGELSTPLEFKLATANVAKNYRGATPEEINNLFENTPVLVYYVQKEFGTQKAGGIRTTSELHEYYNSLPENSPERRAIDELAMARIELSEAKTLHLTEAVQAMAHHYKPDRESEPIPAVRLDAILAPTEDVLGNPEILGIRDPISGQLYELKAEQPADRAAVIAGFKKMNSEQWQQLVDAYIDINSGQDKAELKRDLKQQAAEAGQRFEAILRSLFADNGDEISCKKSMQLGATLLTKYLKDGDIKDKSLEGFIQFMETLPKEENANTANGQSIPQAMMMGRQGGR